MSQPTRVHPHRRALMVAVSAALLLAAAAQTTSAFAHGRRVETAADGPYAHSARTLNGSDTAHLHLVHQHEALLYEQGSASGALGGSMHATLTVGSTFTGSFTIYTSHGSVTGHGSAKPHGSGRYQSFSGTMYVTGGSGEYKHIHGTTSLYGTFDRRTFDVTIQTRGRLTY